MTALRLRTGRRVATNLYVQQGAEPDDSDAFAGHARTPEIADTVCRAVNDGQRPRGCRWWASGGLIYDRPGCSLTRDWIVALDDPDVAYAVITAVRGQAA